MFDFSTNTAPQPKPVNRRQMVLGDLEARMNQFLAQKGNDTDNPVIEKTRQLCDDVRRERKKS